MTGVRWEEMEKNAIMNTITSFYLMIKLLSIDFQSKNRNIAIEIDSIERTKRIQVKQLTVLSSMSRIIDHTAE